MADKSLIEWTDTTWQIVTGCSVVSPGCTNCYAMRLAGGRMQHHPSRVGLTTETKAGPVWNGQVRFNAAWLTQPLGWKKPRKIFVAAHGDLFHEGVTDAQLDQIFAVMALCPQHVFQVLTKRPERMREYMISRYRLPDSIAFFYDLPEDGSVKLYQPPPNVWLGVSVEDQTRADERIPTLLATPAAVRWISAEPLLGPLNLRDAMWAGDGHPAAHLDASIDWVVVGGESGPGARPMHPDWVRPIRDICLTTDTAFLFKQWGAYKPCQPVYWDDDPIAAEAFVKANYGPDEKVEDWDLSAADAVDYMKDFPDVGVLYRDGFFYDGVEFQPAPGSEAGCWWVERVGKKEAGRLLDGVLHDGYPATGAAAGGRP